MATMTIVTTNPNAQELAAAVGDALRLGRSATEAEIKTLTIAYLRTFVLDYRRAQATRQVTADDFAPT